MPRSKQFQLGVYGETVDAVICAHEARVRLDRSAWDMLCKLLEVDGAKRDEQDSGIWESRAGPQHYSLSRVIV